MLGREEEDKVEEEVVVLLEVEEVVVEMVLDVEEGQMMVSVSG